MSEAPRDDSEPAPTEPEPVVEGVAVELPGEVTPLPPVPPAPVAPDPPAAPVGPSPVVVTPPSPVAAAKPAPPTSPSVSSTGEAVGSAFDGHAPEPPMNPLGGIAADRPEILVGAAFAGGILVAMILRRLGS